MTSVRMTVRTGLDVPCLLDHLVVDFAKETLASFQSAAHSFAGRHHRFTAHLRGCGHQGTCALGEAPDVIRNFITAWLFVFSIVWIE